MKRGAGTAPGDMEDDEVDTPTRTTLMERQSMCRTQMRNTSRQRKRMNTSEPPHCYL
jgi:hypothetical protein